MLTCSCMLFYVCVQACVHLARNCMRELGWRAIHVNVHVHGYVYLCKCTFSVCGRAFMCMYPCVCPCPLMCVCQRMCVSSRVTASMF